MPADAQLLAVNLRQVDTNTFSWLLQSIGTVASEQVKTINDTLPFPGVKEGGTYLFLRALSPIGFVTGTVSDNESNPLTSALVTADNHSLI